MDYYQLQSPAAAAGSTLVMHAIAWSTDSNNLYPAIHVFNAQGAPIPVQVLGNGNGTYAVQVTGIQPSSTYYVEVAALNPTSSNNVGNYFLGVKFGQNPPVTLGALGFNTLSAANATDPASLNLTQSTLFNISLTADTGTAAEDAVVALTIADASGNTVLTLTATAGQPAVTGLLYLPAGNYTLNYSARSRSGAALGGVNYWLFGGELSSPIGPYSSPGSGSSGPGTNTGYTYTGSSSTSSSPTPPAQY
jgi:hypothetical protein